MKMFFGSVALYMFSLPALPPMKYVGLQPCAQPTMREDCGTNDTCFEGTALG